jgi:hypothetical protein
MFTFAPLRGNVADDVITRKIKYRTVLRVSRV